LLKQGDVQGSSQLFERSLQLFPEQLRVLLLVGGVELQRDPAQALPWFRRCVATYPEVQDGYYGLAVALARTGDFEAAVGSANAALALNPRYYDAQILMAQLLGRLGRAQEARTHAIAALELKPMVKLPLGITAAPAR
jgi:tetratricopeptide (TPR) repeat protein